MRAIHQVLPTFAGGDAIGNFAARIQQTLLGFGFDSRIFAHSVEPAQRGKALPLSYHASASSGGDGVIYHHSIGSDVLDYLRRAPCRKLMIYHNVTPGSYVRIYSPALANLLDAGRRALPSLADLFDLAATVSSYNATELAAAGFERVEVLPIPIDPLALARTRSGGVPDGVGPEHKLFIFVGRLLPHKCPHELVTWFDWYVRRRDPSARLLIVGAFDDRLEAYNRALLAAARRCGDRVILAGKVDRTTLVNIYRRADLFISFSEHEGFMVPLLESMATDTAVLACATPAVCETLGPAGVRVDNKSWPTLAELAWLLTHDEALRRAVLARQRERAAHFSTARFRASLAALVERWSAGRSLS